MREINPINTYYRNQHEFSFFVGFRVRKIIISVRLLLGVGSELQSIIEDMMTMCIIAVFLNIYVFEYTELIKLFMSHSLDGAVFVNIS